MKQIKIGNYLVANNEPPLFFPDIGSFFNDDSNIAKALIKSLHNQGAQVIKGEILNNINISLNDNSKTSYLGSNNQAIEETFRSIIERKVVSFDAYKEKE